MQTACFSNIKTNIQFQLNNAKKEVVIAMAWFTNNDLFDNIISCLKRGVNVELILLDDAINWQPYAPDFNEFIKAGGVFRIASTNHGFLHHKFCVIDRSITITGSYNWTYYAETRNIENILLSDNSEIANKYLNEFNRLSNIISITNECPRLSWYDMEQVQHIDYEMLNYEIEIISMERKVPANKVFRSNTKVEIVERRFNPKCAQGIGIQATNNGDNDYMHFIINKRDKLPITKKIDFFSNIDLRDGLECKLYYGDSMKASDNHLLIEKKIKELTNNSTAETLKIRIQLTLNTNGHLHAEIRCIETGRAIDLTTTNLNLVKYES